MISPRRKASGGYLILKSLELDNFRGFEKLKLSNLTRVNVITGPNATGKTALLEAVQLGLKGTTAAIAQLNQSRSLPAYAAPGIAVSPPLFRAIWDNLFFNLDTTREIAIKYTDSNRQRYSLKMYYATAHGGVQPVMGDMTSVVPFALERQRNKETPQRIEPLGPGSAWFASHSIFSETDNVAWFSALSAQNQEQPVLDMITKSFPIIKSLAVLAPAGLQGIWADIGDKKLPVSLVSSGINKILTLSLASVSYKSGVLLIDEFENGLWHEFYGKMWEYVYALAKKNDNQLFVSSHSLECLKALAPLARKNNLDFCLLRTRQEHGGLVVRQVSGGALAAALSGINEVR